MRATMLLLIGLTMLTGCSRLDSAPVVAVDAGADGSGSDTGGAGSGSGSEGSGSGSGSGPEALPLEPVDGSGNYIARDCELTAEFDTAYQPRSCSYGVPKLLGTSKRRLSCGTSTDLPQVVRITFPTDDASRTAALLWVTSEANRSSVVHLGEAPDALNREYYGYNFSYSGLSNRRTHEVHICDLEPSKTYYYKVGGEGGWSEVKSFVTAPEKGSAAPFSFAVIGDTRSPNYDSWKTATDQLLEKGADFMLFSGDAVEVGPVQAQWDLWFQKGANALAQVPFVPTNGNHDQVVVTYFAQFALPGRERNFVMRYGNMVVVSMCDTPLDESTLLGTTYKDFLDTSLEANADATWKIVLNHRPLYSASTNHGSALDLQDFWLPIIDKHNVDLVFNGHDHNYERSRPIRNRAVVAPGEGTVFIVAAGVGAPLYDNGAGWWTEVSEKTENYLMVDVNDRTLNINAYRLDGTQLDTLTLTK